MDKSADTDRSASPVRELDPFVNWDELHGDQPTNMRLFEISYICPLCGLSHIVELYISAPTDNLDELNARAGEMAANPQVMVPIILSNSENIHTEVGDCDALMMLIHSGARRAKTAILQVVMTGEAKFTCEECAHTFKSLGDLRVHAGRDPVSAAKVSAAACNPD